jgi:glyoxylase-like metal-dependent hydrolase (beta-lactamase superfamily II)
MAAAEPRPATLPLPGGKEGATVRVEPMLTGTCLAPPAWFLGERGRLAWRKALGMGLPRSQWLTSSVPAFLVHHPGAGPMLVDTGFHASVAVDPKASLGRLGALAFKGIEMAPEQAVAAQLRARGMDAGDVKVVLMTHLHIDHASAMSEFGEATFLFSTAEWAAATTQGPKHGYERRQFDHAFDYRTLDFDSDDANSFSGFGRTFDVFGDGSVRVAFTPGHTLGHMSVILNTARGELLLAGDAIYLMRNLTENHLPYRMEDEHLYRRSMREIELYRREAPDAVIVPSHDVEVVRGLDAAY